MTRLKLAKNLETLLRPWITILHWKYTSKQELLQKLLLLSLSAESLPKFQFTRKRSDILQIICFSCKRFLDRILRSDILQIICFSCKRFLDRILSLFQEAVNFALMMSQMEGGCPVDYDTINDLFLQRNMIREATAFLLDVLKPNLPEHAHLQTKVLEINLVLTSEEEPVAAPKVDPKILRQEHIFKYKCSSLNYSTVLDIPPVLICSKRIVVFPSAKIVTESWHNVK